MEDRVNNAEPVTIDVVQNARALLRDAQSIEIIRCEECAHRQNPNAPKWCYVISKETDADDFCSYWDMKDDE